MKTEVVVVLFISLLILGCPWPQPPPQNSTGICPVTCHFGCLQDNVTCRTTPNPCTNVTCRDKCEDTSVLDTNGECNSETGICVYRKMPCIFGCANDSCSPQPLCPVNCPFGCEPGTDVCVTPTCPVECMYGCIPGTLQCSLLPPISGVKNGDFGNGYAGWNTSGNAFGSAPTSIDAVNAQKLYRNVPYSGYSGLYFASSYFPQMDKRAMGTLTSEPFFIDKGYVEFLVIGDYSAEIYIELIVNNTVVQHLEPDHSYPPFERIAWNVSEYAGQSGIINVVDSSITGSIEIGDFRLVDTPSLELGESYVDSYRNFSILPPTNWLVVHPSVRGEVFFYGSTDDNFTTQLMVMSEKVNANETTETYFAKGKKGLSLLLQNYSAESENSITLGGLNARQLDYDYSSLGLQLKCREAFLVYNGIGYRISGTSTKSSFDRSADDFTNSIQSFKP